MKTFRSELNSLGDNALMTKVKDGDIDKLGLLFERYKKPLFGFFYGLNGDAALSEDLLQNVFFRILKYRYLFREDGEFRTWMFHIARNVNHDHFRKIKWKGKDDLEHWQERLSNGENRQTEFQHDEELQLLSVALSRLTEEKREIPSLPMASALLILGIASGYFLQPASPADQGQIEVLTRQVSNLQEMMMLSLLEKGSATERLKAVSLTREMDEASLKVTNALIQTLNEDENINVRLAALDALKPYAADPGVREALVRAIVKQESPLVQVSLAELMVALQERSAVKEFEKIVDSDKTPIEVRRKIRESIEILI